MSDSYEVIDASLAKVKELLTSERAKDYGDPAEAHQVIADFWSTYLGQAITPEDVSLMLALMKIARLKSSPGHEDSMVDGIAYLAIGRAHQEHAKESNRG